MLDGKKEENSPKKCEEFWLILKNRDIIREEFWVSPPDGMLRRIDSG
jgi:hypothetical protein